MSISFAEEIELSRQIAGCMTFETSCDLPDAEFREKCNIAYHQSLAARNFVHGVIDAETFLDLSEEFAGTAAMDQFIQEVDENLADMGIFLW